MRIAGIAILRELEIELVSDHLQQWQRESPENWYHDPINHASAGPSVFLTTSES